MGWIEQLAMWWADYLAASTALLALVLIAGITMRQPVQRMAAAWATMLALVVLVICCAAPGWPRWTVRAWLPMPQPAAAAIPTLASDSRTNFDAVREHLAHLDRQPSVDGATAGRDKLEKNPATATTNPAKAAGVDTKPASFDYATLLMRSLLLGSAMVIAWLILGQFRAWRLCRGASAAPESATAELRSLADPQRRLPRLLVDRRLSSAGAIGLWHPTILLPADALHAEENSRAALRAMLAHELAHIEHGDLWLLALGRLLLVVLYMHPLYWLLRRRVLADQELLADAAAANQCGRHRYAETLVAWARQQPRRGTKPIWGLSIWERPSQLSKRIAVIIDENTNLRVACSRGWRLVNACVVARLVVGLSLLTLSPASPVQAEVANTPPVTAPPTSPQAKPAPQPVALTTVIRGRCVDSKDQSISSAHVMVFRQSQSVPDKAVPVGRMQLISNTGGQQQPAFFGSSSRTSEPDTLLAEARTNADGEFRFDNLPVDDSWRVNQAGIWVVAQAPKKGTAFAYPAVQKTADGKLTVEPLQIAMQTAASLKGKIADTKGKPVSGAVVTCNSTSFWGCPRPGIVCAVTDAEGRYEVNDLTRFDIRSLPPSVIPYGVMRQVSLAASVDHPDYEPGVIEYTKIPATADLTLSQPANLNGRVVLDGSGEPAANAFVQWVSKDFIPGGVKTGPDGSFAVRRLSPGKYSVTVEGTDRPATTQSVDLAAGDNRLDVSLKKGAIIKGRLIDDATGQPVHPDSMSAAEVHAYIPERRETSPNKVLVGKDGTFTLRVEPGRNAIVLPYPQYQLKDAATWTEKGVEVALGETREIELRVTPHTGGWDSIFGQPVHAPAAAKKETASPTTSAAPEENWSLGDPEMDRIFSVFMSLPDELLPTEPMEAEDLEAVLDSVADVDRKTIDGKERVTSIRAGVLEPMGDPSSLAQALYVSYSIFSNIEQYPDLEDLLLVGSPGADKWLEPLRGHQRLQSLELVWSKNLTAKGVEHLTTIPNLKHLGMFGPHLDDDALVQLGQMPSLETVTFGGVISDTGVAAFEHNSRIAQLSLLAFGKSKLTDESLRTLSGLSKLGHLQVQRIAGEQPFTDEGLKHLATSTSLNTIAVGGKQITDAGLVHLKQLKTLQRLTLVHTSVTDQGVDELKKALPGLKVTRE